ncbi:NADPH-adrenodoxin reductase [Kalmusia sp. IMI 367209]|nr:NADPH-adrenodoxin reductase [Kalmusia sp. IMI 367209]
MITKPLRLAIIGSGPAGFYTAHRLMNKVKDARVDMYEQRITPYGLVRYGVAPDHPEVKNCQDTFDEVASSSRFNYIGNVEIGPQLSLEHMKSHYDAILFAYGASRDKTLGIPGENLYGVYSARDFVGWYNGLADAKDLAPKLDHGEHAIIIGQGNVALDIARILLTPVDILRKTDITEEALEALSRSKVKQVNVVGRRGPLQAAFTVKEARELMQINGVAFDEIDRNLYPEGIKTLPRVQRRIAEVLIKGSQTDIRNCKKKWGLSFLQSPKEICAERGDHVTSVNFQRTDFRPDADPLSKDAKVVLTDEVISHAASLVFRSVGYKSTALQGFSDMGVPFDDRLGIIPNDAYGRIMSPAKGPGDLTAGQLPGLYCAGWVKRGPTGVIASTMQDAFTTADAIVEDWTSGVPFLNTEQGENKSTGLGWDGVKERVTWETIDWEGWKRIDRAERAKGKDLGKERVKTLTKEEQMKIAY